jgi:hypothetical protein
VLLGVLDRLKDALRRREIFVTPSLRYADPRLGMLEGAAWEAVRPQVCRALQRSANGAEELERLAQLLDMTYRRVAAALPQNTAVTITLLDDKPDLTLSPLDKLEEPQSLITLRTSIDSLLWRSIPIV